VPRFALILLLIVKVLALEGQEMSNLRVKSIVLDNDTIILDSLSIWEESFILSIKDKVVAPSEYRLQAESATLYLHFSPSSDTATVVYRVFPILFNTSYSTKDSTLIREPGSDFDPFTYNYSSPGVLGSQSSGLNKSGSITRGISVGNNQDLSVNSSLQLELAGSLGQDINVRASVTDDNIPIQADGSTAQLQDFDNVFIQLYNDKQSLTAGDIVLESPQSHFLRYRKKGKGATYTGGFGTQDKPTSNVQASAAISKGKFARNIIQGIEGVQGPYRLTGGENETFIVVLSGSEQVFIDGQLLRRGQQFDYVIDYNSAELVFTPNQPITKDRRITVEFQYSDKNFARSLFQSHITFDLPKGSTYIGAYAEQDSKNQPLQQELGPLELGILRGAGDNLLSAIAPGVDSVGYSSGAVLYALVDSLGYDSVFVYSTSEDSAFYRLNFTFVGQGNGDYSEAGFTASGRVFQWIAPDTISGNIVHRGAYSPIRLLVTPKKKQMVIAGGDFQFGQIDLSVEGALSNRDDNTFSSLDARDDLGYGAFLSAKRKRNLETGAWQLLPLVTVDWNSEHFNPIERIRGVEFTRDWNLTTIKVEDILLAEVGTELYKKDEGSLVVSGLALRLKDKVSGEQAKLTTNYHKAGWTLTVDGSALQTSGQNEGTFIRHRGLVKKSWKYFSLGYKDEHENNKRLDAQLADTVQRDYQFYDNRFFIAQGDSSHKNFELYYRQRSDKFLENKLLTTSSHAEQLGLEAEIIKTQDHRLGINASTRRLTGEGGEFSQKPENTIIGRVDHYLRLARGAMSFNTYYATGSGLEQKKEFIYLEVPAGQGSYVWNDYNSDGVQDLGEFEVAQFGYEANYIRTFIPSSDYARTYTTAVSHTMQLSPSKIWGQTEGIKKALSRCANNASVSIERKTNFEQKTDRFNPFILDVADTSLLALNSSFRNTLFFNRSNADFGMNYTFGDSRNKNLLTNGFESRNVTKHEVAMRWNLIDAFTLNTRAEAGQSSAQSDFLSSRNYLLDVQSGGAELSWQPDPGLRLGVSATWTERKNRPEYGPEKASSYEVGVSGKWSKLLKGSVQGEFKWVEIDYNAPANNTLAFEMLGGLQPGRNFTWGLSVQRKLSGNLQLNLVYNGRSSESTNVVHNGGLQIRAFF
jgi:hypothetical protein